MSVIFQGKAPGIPGGLLTATLTAGDRKYTLFQDLAIDPDGTFRIEIADEALKPALDSLAAATGGAAVALDARRGDDVQQRALPATAIVQGVARQPKAVNFGVLDFVAKPAAAEAAELERLRTAVGDRDKLVEKHVAGLAALTTERDNLKAQIASVTTESSKLKDQLAVRNTEVTRLNRSLAEKNQRIKALEDAAAATAAAAATPRPIPLASVIGSLAEQAASIDKADAPGGRWQLSDLRVTLKALVDEDGAKVRFPKPGEPAASSAHLSAFEFSLRPGRGAASRNQVKTPDVTGYTSLMAVRKVEEAGLKTAISYEAVADEEGKPKRAGLVVQQRPPAATLVEPGATVELLVGKA
jgi:hypothetical protein